ncbi:MAG: ribosome biogenesis GTP-binding protein YihA/YsxC [Fimbriimonadaceae bacterium]|nr:ribosome biogenesis GTP-binding protein YihA/YsxC [Alphaproteobacteria bacterium]
MGDTPQRDQMENPTPDIDRLEQDRHTAEEIEAGRLLFAGPCEFITSVAAMNLLPDPTRPEVAFAGRSNVGKSSLLNALTNRKGLARTSNTPGRTQLLNFFDLGGRVFLVDMPGYGYARASRAQIREWTRLIHDYLAGRPSLARVFILVDSRHGLKSNDTDIMDMLDKVAVSYQCVLTKADKPKSAELEQIVSQVTAALRKRPAAHPVILQTSSREMLGIEELRAEICAIANSF